MKLLRYTFGDRSDERYGNMSALTITPEQIKIFF